MTILEIKIGQQVLAFGLDAFRQLVIDTRQQVARVLVVALVVAQPRQVEPDPVLNRVGYAGVQQLRKQSARFLVQAVAVEQVCEQQVGLVSLRGFALRFLACYQQPGDCVEFFFLEELVQGLTVVQVLHAMLARRSCRQRHCEQRKQHCTRIAED